MGELRGVLGGLWGPGGILGGVLGGQGCVGPWSWGLGGGAMEPGAVGDVGGHGVWGGTIGDQGAAGVLGALGGWLCGGVPWPPPGGPRQGWGLQDGGGGGEAMGCHGIGVVLDACPPTALPPPPPRDRLLPVPPGPGGLEPAGARPQQLHQPLGQPGGPEGTWGGGVPKQGTPSKIKTVLQNGDRPPMGMLPQNRTPPPPKMGTFSKWALFSRNGDCPPKTGLPAKMGSPPKWGLSLKQGTP